MRPGFERVLLSALLQEHRQRARVEGERDHEAVRDTSREGKETGLKSKESNGVGRHYEEMPVSRQLKPKLRSRVVAKE